MNRGVLLTTLISVICFALFLTGCPKSAPQPEPVPPTPIPTFTPKPTPIPEPTKSPDELRMEKLDEAKSYLSINDIYFDFDRAILSDDSRASLAKKAEYLTRNPAIRVTIEGHCDERGSNEYNLGLGERRAATAKKYLVTYGVPDKNVDIVTYGEEKPLCHESNEDCWMKNRRAHFTVNY